ncbi:MAG: AbrB/MazE/SpoVT family DNA-binding domain-containing protein [Alphaproteobacteria bacterium]|nr:AbrB/MazE/SpoVT family DNA-binding domain-containing protein [Alphaproteobacteria bacterium]
METVSVSPKFQVVIPRRIREALGLRPGQKLQAVQYGDRVELIPLRPLSAARGFLSGIATDIERDEDRA